MEEWDDLPRYKKVLLTIFVCLLPIIGSIDRINF